jgi:large subunit ribosomal protein L30
MRPAMNSLNSKNIKVTLLRSSAGRSESQKRTLVSLGLKKIGQSRVLPNLNPILGQVNKVIQWVKVEPAE